MEVPYRVLEPADATSAIPLSLYESECDDLNEEEAKLRDVFASTEGVEWWHRVIEKKGFKKYRYFMVFRDKPVESAYTLADFAEMLKTM